MQPSLSVYTQYSDNVDLAHDNEVGAMRYQITPGLSFIRPSPRRQMKFDLNLKADYRDKDNGDEDSLFWFDTYGYLGREVSPRTAYELTASFNAGYTESNIKAPFQNVFSSVDRSTSFTIGPAMRYNITRTTTSKWGYNYTRSSYSGDGTADAQEHVLSMELNQQVGSRIMLDLGGLYNTKQFSDSTRNYKDLMIPFGVSFDLTYLKVRVGGLYLKRYFKDNRTKTERRLGSQLGVELGGNLLRLKATSVDINFSTNYYNDIYGQAYTNEEIQLEAFHAFRKFDAHFYYRIGRNKYMQRPDRIDYSSYGMLWKWRVNNAFNLEIREDYDIYEYTPSGSNYDISRTSLESTHYLTDVLLVGVGYRYTTSDSNVTAGNYKENLYSIFARAVW